MENINELFKRALNCNPKRYEIWQEYIIYCKRIKDKTYMMKKVEEMLQVICCILKTLLSF